MNRLVASGQVPSEDLLLTEFDGFIGACGFEGRCRFAASRLRFRAGAWNVVVPFSDNKVLERLNNERFFRAEGFDFTQEVAGSQGESLFELISEGLDSNPQDVFRLAIDYSGMTRSWYGALIRSAFGCVLNGRRLDITFIYSPAAFTSPLINPPRNKIAEPLPGFCYLRANSDPTALLIGLGYEAHRAVGIKSYLDPEKTVLFYTSPAIDPRFTDIVIKNNQMLFDEVPPQWVFPYSLADLDYTASILHDVVADLSTKHRVVIAPLGVKPFSLLSMLLVTRFRFADVWRVSGAELAPPLPRDAIGKLLSYRVALSDHNGQLRS